MNAPIPTPAELGTAPYVLRADAGGVATLTLNRGERYNPLSRAMIDAIQVELDRLRDDRTIRVVVIAGSGKGFSAGHDLKEMRAHTGEDAERWQRELFDSCTRMMLALTGLPQPVIARVHGIATAAGCQLVSMCDLAVASEESRFALSGINAGIFCSTPAVGVARNVGRKRAMEFLVTGEMIDAATALQWGLVNRVVPLAALDTAVQALTERIAAFSPMSIAAGKRTFYRQIELGLTAAYEEAARTMVCNVLDPDGVEGMDAFLGKRAPRWGQG